MQPAFEDEVCVLDEPRASVAAHAVQVDSQALSSHELHRGDKVAVARDQHYDFSDSLERERGHVEPDTQVDTLLLDVRADVFRSQSSVQRWLGFKHSLSQPPSSEYRFPKSQCEVRFVPNLIVEALILFA